MTSWLALAFALAARDAGVLVDAADAGPRPVEVPDAGPRPIEVPDAGAHDVNAGAHDAGGVAGFTLTARLDPDPVTFGHAVDVVVTITRPALKRLVLPDDLEGSEALPRLGEPRREAKELPDGRVQEILRFPFLALDLDGLQTPAFALRSDDGVVLEVPSLPVRVQAEALPDPTDGGTPGAAMALEGEAGFLIYRVRDDRPWIVLAVVLVGAAVVVGVRLLLRARPRTPPPGPPPPPPRPAHEVALERLDAILPLLQRDEVSLFVEKLMDEVLRDYLAARFALHAGTRTTREIVNDLLGIAVAGLDVALVERVGQDADLIKFARATLSAEQAHAMAGRVRALILATALPATTTATSEEAP